MPPRPHRPDALAWQVFRGSDAIRNDLLTEHQLRSSAWLRLRHDVYADARLDRDHALACRAALLRLPPGVVVAGPSAAYLHGVEHAAAFTDDVHVLVPRPLRIGAQRGLRVHTNSITPMPDVATTDPPPPGAQRPPQSGQPSIAQGPNATWHSPSGAGHPPGPAQAPGIQRPAGTGHPPGTGQPSVVGMTVPLARQLLRRGDAVVGPDGRAMAGPVGGTVLSGPQPARDRNGRIPRSDPGRAAWETSIWLEPVRAVTIVDSLLGQGLIQRDTLVELAARNVERPGGRRAQWVFALADPGAQSPPESQLRVRLVLGGLPRPIAQHPIRLPDGVLLHPDLAWPEYRVAVEYDGQWHADADQLHRDRRRLNLLVGAGWLVLHVTSRRLHTDFPAVLQEVRTALTARGWRR
ncbi:DUF559 domain-containing protein [Micromonospora sp. 067-2]|uniref:DUF559 domain-containing protein n=1 Tax=Micromonospora sp. 067-2 TaxID=2789270 RepID=UPI00397B4011